MGYSCSAKAARVLDAVLEDLTDPNGLSNTWTHNGLVYFVERGREQPDGAITGTVLKQTRKVGDNVYYKPCGSIRIEPDGTITRFPTLSKKQKVELKEKGLKKYAEIFEYVKSQGGI